MASKPKRKRRNGKTAEPKRDKQIDEEVAESFPASDPPSYAGGKHAVGAPPSRQTPQTNGRKR